MLILLFGPACWGQAVRPLQPEEQTGRSERGVAFAPSAMVAAAHPLAVDAALAMLDRGGSAADGAVAAQLVLNLVEPQSSGLGGGAYALYHDRTAATVRAYDGRETAPRAVTPELFMGPDGEPMAFRRAQIGGRAVGVPGVARLLGVLHRRHGRLPWASQFEPAMRLAEQGYPLTPRTHALLRRARALDADPAARALYYRPDGEPLAAGTRLVNPAFAATLRALAEGGDGAFYEGPIARDIVAAVRGHAGNPGVMTAADLADYRVRELAPLCAPYRAWRVCGMPPSSAGGIAVLQILGIVERFDMRRVRPGSAEAVHLLAEAGRLAFADRNRYVADDTHVAVPVAGLLDPTYLAARAALVRRESAMGRASPGEPPGARTGSADSTTDPTTGTSHLAIVDREGNAVSMTSSIESSFGSRVMVRGFLLNNQLTDFDFVPLRDGRPVANAPAPGKRPRSSMAPTLVFDAAGRLHMAVGSPGGSRIINYVAKVLVATLDWGLDIQAAAAMPNFGSRNGPTEIEKGTALEAVAATLRAIGHPVSTVDMTSGVHGLVRGDRGWYGGADPRREGLAKGY